MTKKLFKKTILIWFLLAFLAIANGIVRNSIYKPIVGDLVAHQISTFFFIAILFLVSYFAFRKEIDNLSNKELLNTGLIWLILTEAFEFLAGHYVFGNSWGKILADYNIFAGRLWLLVILATTLSPYLVKKYYSYISKSRVMCLCISAIIIYSLYLSRNQSGFEGYIALILGILGVFRSELRDTLLEPVMDISMKISDSQKGQDLVKWYNLNIKNTGCTTIKNIRVKIKSEENKEWLILRRPFWATTPELKSNTINRLSPKEEDNFNLGRIDSKEKDFWIIADPEARNQKLHINIGEKHCYILEIVSDNTKPVSYKVNVNNKGFECDEIIKLEPYK